MAKKDNDNFSSWDARETAKSLIDVSPKQDIYHLRVALVLMNNVQARFEVSPGYELVDEAAELGGILDDLWVFINEIVEDE